MNELIKINNENKVDGRSLHEFLQIESNYTTWFNRMCEYGFTEGVDFFPKMEETSPNGGRPSINHDMTIEMAKEISMIQRNERGKQARLYFIECEKRLKQASKSMNQLEIMAESIRILQEQDKRMAQIEQEQAEQKQELQDIRDVVTLRPDSWRDDTKYILDKIAAALGGDSEAYKDIRNQSYTELEKRAHCRLKQQLKNAKKRMEERGASKTEINSLRILDMIDKNQRLIEIYLSVVKDMAIHHGVTLNTVLF